MVVARSYSFDLPRVSASYSSNQAESLVIDLELGTRFSLIVSASLEIEGSFSPGLHNSGESDAVDPVPIFASLYARIDDPNYHEGEIDILGLPQIPYSDGESDTFTYGPREAITSWTWRPNDTGEFLLRNELTSSVLRPTTIYMLAEGATPPPPPSFGLFPPDLSFLLDGSARLSISTSWTAILSPMFESSLGPDSNLPGLIIAPQISLTSARLIIEGAAIPEPSISCLISTLLLIICVDPKVTLARLRTG